MMDSVYFVQLRRRRALLRRSTCPDGTFLSSIRISFLLGALVLTAGCAASPTIEPLATTYPKGRSEEVTNTVNLPLPFRLSANTRLKGGDPGKPVDESIAYSPGTQVLQGKYTETKVGDSAEAELWIVPRNTGEANEESLLARLDEGGKRACHGNYRIKSTKFYYGREATLRYLGINNTPAVKALYRCPASRLSVADADVKFVADLSSRLRDAEFFDISSFPLFHDEASVIAGLQSSVAGRRMKVVEQGHRNGGYYLIASRDSGTQSNLVPEILVAFVRGVNGGSKLTLLYMAYEQTHHERGVAGAGTKQRGFVRGPQPVSRDTAYDKARALVEQLGPLPREKAAS